MRFVYYDLLFILHSPEKYSTAAVVVVHHPIIVVLMNVNRSEDVKRQKHAAGVTGRTQALSEYKVCGNVKANDRNKLNGMYRS